VAAIAGALRPKKLVAIKVANVVRLAVTAAGCTVAACATSNAVAAARAWTPAEVACPDAAVNHPTYGAAAAAIDAEAGPAHGPAVNPTTTESNDDADACKSCANPSQAVAAICNGPDPAPAKIRAELISGGNHANSRTMTTPTQPAALAVPITTHPEHHAQSPSYVTTTTAGS
jgi:hypothetical protein